MAIPSPADAPTMSAADVIAYVRSQGGRVFRYVLPPRTFVLTDSPDLVQWLIARKGLPFAPVGWHVATDGSYERDSVTKAREWDIVIVRVPVTDDLGAEIATPGLAIWKAAA